jgi:hypothetical protein
VSDLGASAAYWLASAASSISATPHSNVGSIGVFTVAYDTSAMYESHGVKAHLVTSGGQKGRGGFVDGIAVEKQDIEVLQKSVDAVNDSFVKGVAAGRKMSIADVKALNTGEVWQGAEAKKRNLVDHVLTPTSNATSTFHITAIETPIEAALTAPEVQISFSGVAMPSIGMGSNMTPAMNPTEENLPMPDQPTPPPAAAAPDAGATGRADARILEAVEGLKTTFDSRISALEKQNRVKTDYELAVKKNEAIALGLDEKLVDECESVAEVGRLVKAFRPVASIPSGGVVAATNTRGKPPAEAGPEQTAVAFHEKLQSDMAKSAEAWEKQLVATGPMRGEMTFNSGDDA